MVIYLMIVDYCQPRPADRFGHGWIRISAMVSGTRRSGGSFFCALFAVLLLGGGAAVCARSIPAAVTGPFPTASIVADRPAITLAVTWPWPGEYRLRNLIYDAVSPLESLDGTTSTFSAEALQIAVYRYETAGPCWDDVLRRQDVWLDMGGTLEPVSAWMAAPFARDMGQNAPAWRGQPLFTVRDQDGGTCPGCQERAAPLPEKAAPVPLPAAQLLLGGGLLGLHLWRRLRMLKPLNPTGGSQPAN